MASQLSTSRVEKERLALDIQVSRWCPERVYVELPIPEDIHTVSLIVFRTVSHDQGYSGTPESHGTYESSYTWFEAVVLSPGGHERCARRVVQYNVQASSQYKHHEVAWSADSEDASLREWLLSVRGGDVLQLIPKAQFPGWINFVREAELEVHGSLLAGSTVSAPRYYRHLDSSEIRLLHLNPGNEDDPVSCFLTYANLKDHPIVSYEALSYCWGDLRDSSEIVVRSSDYDRPFSWTMPAPSSLLSALKALRPRTEPARVVWIDAICVNQNDLDERSSQVSLMADIYRRAHRVIVWLGEGDDKTHKSIQTINAISERHKQSDTWHGASSEALAALHGPLMENDNVYWFIENWSLFLLPWFRRTWVVQEIFNAEQSVLYCGADSLAWDALLRVNECIPLRGLTMKTASKALMPPIYNMLFSAKVTHAGGLRFTDIEILDVLVQGLDLDATDPRDKLFAMLQFGRETWDFSSLPAAILPNYNRTPGETFALFTKWWITEHRSLRILSAIHALEGRTWQKTRWDARDTSSTSALGLPSWSWGFRGHSNWTIGLLGLSADCTYRASGDTMPDMQIIGSSSPLSSPGDLNLTGFQIGVVDKIESYPYYRTPDAKLKNLHRAYVGIFDPLNLTGKWSYQLNSRYKQNYVDVEIPSEMAGHFGAHADFSRRTAGVECISRCFYTTKEGFVGLCPHATRPGDWIVILHGGYVPYVLRPRGENGKDGKTYEFVGECYAEGYMDGHGLEVQRQKSMRTEVFVLI